MNINPKAIRILCYGDSNTRGSAPGHSRYPVNIRWTGVLQELLGSGYEVIEEGLGGRTTRFDDPKREGRNGKVHLLPCLESHNPLDWVILSLGTNDFKDRFSQSPQDIAESMRSLISIVKERSFNSQGMPSSILLLAPPIPDETVVEEQFRSFVPKSKELGKEYEKVAGEEGCAFIDLAQHIQPSNKDGLHFEPEGHRKIGELVAQSIQKLS
jgi:lysophospholipase L1-like esterase